MFFYNTARMPFKTAERDSGTDFLMLPGKSVGGFFLGLPTDLFTAGCVPVGDTVTALWGLYFDLHF